MNIVVNKWPECHICTRCKYGVLVKDFPSKEQAKLGSLGRARICMAHIDATDCPRGNLNVSDAYAQIELRINDVNQI